MARRYRVSADSGSSERPWGGATDGPAGALEGADTDATAAITAVVSPMRSQSLPCFIVRISSVVFYYRLDRLATTVRPCSATTLAGSFPATTSGGAFHV